MHMAQLMPMPLTVSCCSKIQIGFTCLVPAHPASPGHRAVKRGGGVSKAGSSQLNLPHVCLCVFKYTTRTMR